MKAKSQTRRTRTNRTPRTPERLEERCTPSGFRTIDGTGNNDAHSDWGSAGADLLRTAPAEYADGASAPTVGSPARPSARLVSNVLVAQTTEERVISDRFLSAMIYGWGQFIDHDMDLTPKDSPAVPFHVVVPNDPSDPFSTAATPPGPGVIFVSRSDFDPATGTGSANPRQQTNVVTAFLDASMVYGSDAVTADKLRTHSGGRLKTSPGADGVVGTQDDLLPFNNTTYFPASEGGPLPMDNDARRVADDQLFAAGDARANENIELTSLHTLFVREHNRIAGIILAANPGLSDEAVYQYARAAVGVEIQSITYNQWLPSLLGQGALTSYQGYRPNVNPGIANEFSTAVFRIGHSMLGADVEFLDNDGEEIREEVELNDAFSNPGLVVETDIGPILKYLATDPSSEVDNSIVDPVRNFLFGAPGAGGFDLAALNIQRGRDHGLADYNDTRAAYGLSRVTSFAQISSDPDVRAKLQQLYGNVNNIDLWVGALAEDHVQGSSTGPLMRAVIKDQFQRLRDGDSSWYQRILSGRALDAAERTTLADIIGRNTPISNLQDNVFSFRLSIVGTVFSDGNRNGRRDRGEGGLGGRTMQLFAVEDGVATLVTTTTTDGSGAYTFDVADGLAAGTFRVRQVLPSGWARTTANPGDFTFTRGGQSAANVNFGNARGGSAALSVAAPGETDATSGVVTSSPGPSGADLAVFLTSPTALSGTTASKTGAVSSQTVQATPIVIGAPTGGPKAASGSVLVTPPTGKAAPMVQDAAFSDFGQDPLTV